MGKEELSKWLLREMESRDWTQADLSRQSKISPPQISRILSGLRGPAPESVVKLARAFNVPPELLLRIAGMLPEKQNTRPFREKAEHLFNQLNAVDQQEVIAYLEMKLRHAEQQSITDVLRANLEAADPKDHEAIIKSIEQFLVSSGLFHR